LSAKKLTAAEFHILLALADEDRHGLGIVDEVERRTDGEVMLGPGILYGSLKRMAAEGLVEEAVERPDPEHDDPRRRYYHITELGNSGLRAEASKWARVVEVAQEKEILDKRAAT